MFFKLLFIECINYTLTKKLNVVNSFIKAYIINENYFTDCFIIVNQFGHFQMLLTLLLYRLFL